MKLKTSIWMVLAFFMAAALVVALLEFGSPTPAPAPMLPTAAPKPVSVPAVPISKPSEENQSSANPSGEVPSVELPLSPLIKTDITIAKTVAPPDTEPPYLQVLEPDERSYVLTPHLKIRVASEAGVEVLANGNKLAEYEPTRFQGELNLAAGANQVQIVARDAAGNSKRVLLQVTYLDPARLQYSRERLQALIAQLEEVRTAENEAGLQVEEILRKMRAIEKGQALEKLAEELREVRRDRQELRQEIEKYLNELDGLMRAAGQ